MRDFLDFEARQPETRSQVTPEERALIDEAIAQGRVQVIPQGASVYSNSLYYDADQGQLRYKAGGTFNSADRQRNLGDARRSAYHSRRAKQASDAAEEAARLSLLGLTARQTAEKMGVNVKTVVTYLNDLEKTGRTVKPHSCIMEHIRSASKPLTTEDIVAQTVYSFHQITQAIAFHAKRGALKYAGGGWIATE